MAVQVAAPSPSVGSATAALSFFRSLGGVLGTSVFGTLYARRLDSGLDGFMERCASATPERVRNLTGLGDLGPSAEVAARLVYSDAVTQVFAWVVPVALLGLLAAFLLPRLDLASSSSD